MICAGEAMAERYYLTKDNDSHWYVVPLSKKTEWEAWKEIPSDDERTWEAPDFARRTYGSYELVTFENPEIEE